MVPSGAPVSVTGWAIWARPLGLLALILVGPLLLLPTGLSGLATTWIFLLLASGWCFFMATLIGAMVGTSQSAPTWLLFRLRCFVARFAPDPARLWLHWARQSHDDRMARRCLEQAAALGGGEALFQEGLVFLEGGFGAGGQMTALARFRQAAEGGHPEAAFRYAEGLRTGLGPARNLAEAEAWYLRAARSGFGPAAAWLAQAYAQGDGVAVDGDKARHWATVAAGLAPHPPLSRSLLHHSAAPEDSLRRGQAWVGQGLEEALGRWVTHPLGRWSLGIGVVLLILLAFVVLASFFWAGSSQLYHLPLIMLAPPLLLLARQAWRLRQEGPRRGRDRLREAAEGGDPEACYRVGLQHRAGTPQHPKDDQEAVRWFRKAAEGGHPGAMAALAEAYLGGHGVVRDPREAARWAESARRSQLPGGPVR